MKTFVTIPLLVLVILGAIGTAYFATKWYTRPKVEESKARIADSAVESVQLDVKNINREIDRNSGIEHALMKDKEQLVISYNQLKDSSRQEIDSLTKLLGIRNRQLSHYVGLAFTSTREDEPMTETDTTYNFKDNWLSVDIKKPANGVPALLNSKYNASPNLAWYWESNRFIGLRSPLFGRELIGNFWLSDPNATISGVKYLRIEPPEKRFGLAVMAVGEYYHDDVLFGGGVSVDIGRLRLQGNYLRDFSSGKWYPAFRGGFKLIDIN
ncbi:hypothetical protein [Parapedobacter indicus]|uniref:Uncharacterized protein n=1 Tax=Parapedobacter indicus TaxID=1477437 RepID=A0A1I3VSE7_9SPHI|nr:hypothetical protein [Parapedobacter indicus]PPK97848.1 hypothetical protein CLV26_1244 [Parapedobacter indicus]SFJ98059.1 hypothetical protein SAMN05444682_1242 [Parapedobacter indicus]